MISCKYLGAIKRIFWSDLKASSEIGLQSYKLSIFARLVIRLRSHKRGAPFPHFILLRKILLLITLSCISSSLQLWFPVLLACFFARCSRVFLQLVSSPCTSLQAGLFADPHDSKNTPYNSNSILSTAYCQSTYPIKYICKALNR